jgi:peptidoglycan/LPS O-acetylase OafA/YrhL
MEQILPSPLQEVPVQEVPVSDSRIRNPQFLAPGPSIILDIVRFLAAVTVAVGHLSEGYFTTGWPSSILMKFAVGAVSVFFILSGFMIRYVTRVKYGDLRRYAVDRFARIYSVVLPSLAVTIVFGVLASHFNYSYYYSNFGKSSGRITSHIPLIQSLLLQSWFRDTLRIFGTITMLSQSWFQDLVPLVNNPFWSLSYECVYYALFGIFLYLRGPRRTLWWAIVFFLIGPTVFLMFPIWLLGCAAYDAYEEGVWKRSSVIKLVGFSLLSIAGVHGSHAVMEHLHLHHFNINRVVLSMDFVAIATVAILLPVCIAARDLRISEKHLFVRAIRRVAAATFPLYLIHFPFFVLAAAIVPYHRAGLLPKLVLLTVALALSLVLADLCDRLKDSLRGALMRKRKV